MPATTRTTNTPRRTNTTGAVSPAAPEFTGLAAPTPAGAPPGSAGTTLGMTSGPAQPDGSGPTGAGTGPSRTGALAPRSFSQAASNPALSTPNAVEKAASSLTPFAYERISPTSASRP